jgi:ribosomal protein S18 acetylase RimI-like enzyme
MSPTNTRWPNLAAAELLALAPEYFEMRPGWWRLARDTQGEPVAFVLPVLLRGERACKEGKPQGTVFYMGVLPAFRGKGCARELLAEATRVFVEAGCWRIFCDTSSRNEPMLRTFRSAGYMERSPWQRPLK